MRTTPHFPQPSTDQPTPTTHTSTPPKVIIIALEDLIRKSKISGLKEFKGKVDLDIDMNAVRGRQCRY